MKVFNISEVSSRYRASLILRTFKGMLTRGDSVLDLGCGTGVSSYYLLQKLKIKITGADIKNYLLYPLPFRLIKEDQRLPFKNNSYDVVMLNDVLHHIEEKSQYEILEEALRIGKKVLIFEARPTFFGKLFDVILNKIHYSDLKAPLTFKDVVGWSKVFKKLGVSHKTIIVKSPFFYPFSHIAFSLTQISSKHKRF